MIEACRYRDKNGNDDGGASNPINQGLSQFPGQTGEKREPRKPPPKTNVLNTSVITTRLFLSV